MGQSLVTVAAMVRDSSRGGVPLGASAMALVGGSVAVSGVVTPGVMLTAGAIRYAVACLLLVGYARVAGRRVPRPRGAEWLWLAGIAATGLVLFNVALVEGSRHAEPAVLGVAVACVPPVLAVAGPLLQGARPRRSLIVAAIVVTCGAALVDGLGRSDALGIGFAVVVFGCEAAFTLLAVPVLGRLGPVGVSAHTAWIASVLFAALAVVDRQSVTRLTDAQWAGVAYLAVGVTAVAFVLWYSAVGRLGPARAGLLAGVTPVSAAITGTLLGAPMPGPAVWIGMAIVGAGLALGLRANRRSIIVDLSGFLSKTDQVPVRGDPGCGPSADM
jgi:drug/metabolite transporter (DMT)-like permease